MLKFTIVLFLLCIVGVSVSVWIGRQQPLPPSVAALHLTDCQLRCWIGIVPGNTPMLEARDKIEQVFSVKMVSLYNSSEFTTKVPPYNFEISIIALGTSGAYVLEDGIVGGIILSFDHPDQYQRIGSILNLLGEPDSLPVSSNYSHRTHTIEPYYQQLNTGVEPVGMPITQCTGISPRSLISRIWINWQGSLISGENISYGWHGFRGCYR